MSDSEGGVMQPVTKGRAPATAATLFHPSKSQLIDWVNQTLLLGITRLEEFASGAVFCQILDGYFIDLVPIHRVNFHAREEYEFVRNYKILQSVLTELNSRRDVDVQKLMRGSPTETLRWLQFMHKVLKKRKMLSDYNPRERRLRSVKGGTDQIPMPYWMHSHFDVYREAGLFASSVVAVPQKETEHMSKESVQQALCDIHNRESNASQGCQTGNTSTFIRSLLTVSDSTRDKDAILDEEEGCSFNDDEEEERSLKLACTTSHHLESIASLSDGVLFAKRFLVGPERVQGKPQILFAVDQICQNEKVVLKFYESSAAFENSKKFHQRLSPDYVCKMLHVVEEDGFPPCLVFERGDDTLDKWLKRTRPDYVTQKSALFQILNCISYLHGQNVIHCDIKPSNLVFFVSKHVWKLLDTDVSIEAGQPCPIQYTPMYASPEMVQAEDRCDTSIILETSADIFSFGILAFEVLTGRRFYGPSATRATAKECLCCRQKFPSLDCLEEKQARRWLSGLLEFDPRQRWTALRALGHAVFKTAEDTTQKAAGIAQILKSNDSRAEEVQNEIKHIKEPIIDEIKNATLEVKEPIGELRENLPEDIRKEVKEPIIEEIKEVGNTVGSVQRTVVATYQEICKANLMANIDLELVGHSKGVNDLTDRVGRRALTFADDYLPDEPVFLLRHGKRHRMRISLAHKHQADAANFRICSVSVQPSDGHELDLEFKETKDPSEGHDVVAWFHADMFPRSKLCRRCPQFGLAEEKYVNIAVKIVIDVAAYDPLQTTANQIVMNGRIWCIPVSRYSLVLNVRKFTFFASEKWRRAPQWMREAARGVVILMEAQTALQL